MPKESITEPLACSLLVFLSYSGLSKFLMFTLHKIGDATNDYFYCQLICQIFSWLIVCRKIEQKWPYQFPKSAAQGDVFKFLFRLISLKPKNIPFIITRQEKEDILTILIYELDIRNLVEKLIISECGVYREFTRHLLILQTQCVIYAALSKIVL